MRDPDATLARTPSSAREPLAVREAAALAACAAARARCRRSSQDDRCAVEQEPGPQREALAAAAAVLEVDDLHAPRLLDPDDRTAPAGLHILDHKPGLGLDLARAPALGYAPVPRENITAVTIVHRGIVDLALDISECQRAANETGTFAGWVNEMRWGA